MMQNEINLVSIELFKRYLYLIKPSKIKQRDKLMSMCEFCISHPEMLTDKMSRWLGFIQGVLYANNLIDINKERDLSRPLFHKAYANLDLEIPEKITI